ncbi:MAG: type I glyceraldehyde-3-phosphate dehydrogenase [Flavobacteriia bacterium]|nr:type I glyceraldehyde-3-phosphate dehydrogenase [Flavobacteriia bacterium]
MKIVGINGFGRIGRCFTRLALLDPNIEVALINDLADVNTLAHLLKYDSIHGGLSIDFTIEGTSLLFSNGKKITFISERNPEDIDWSSHNVNYVIESTGLFLGKEAASKHLKPGVRKVILSAPPSDNDIKSIVLGVNEGEIGPDDKIISNASCTTNNAAPMIKVLKELFPIDVAYISTVHSYTSDQRLHDSPHKDLRRARAATMSIIPTSTGAVKAITKIFPELQNKITGGSVRVPVSDGSMTELILFTSQKVTAEEINTAMKLAAEGNLKGILSYTEDPIVSADIIGNTHSCVFDSGLTLVFNNLIKVVGWYDNEMGYSNRLVDLIKIL